MKGSCIVRWLGFSRRRLFLGLRGPPLIGNLGFAGKSSERQSYIAGGERVSSECFGSVVAMAYREPLSLTLALDTIVTV